MSDFKMGPIGLEPPLLTSKTEIYTENQPIIVKNPDEVPLPQGISINIVKQFYDDIQQQKRENSNPQFFFGTELTNIMSIIFCIKNSDDPYTTNIQLQFLCPNCLIEHVENTDAHRSTLSLSFEGHPKFYNTINTQEPYYQSDLKAEAVPAAAAAVPINAAAYPKVLDEKNTKLKQNYDMKPNNSLKVGEKYVLYYPELKNISNTPYDSYSMFMTTAVQLVLDNKYKDTKVEIKMVLKNDDVLIEIFNTFPKIFAVTNIKNLVLVREGSYYPQYFSKEYVDGTIKPKALAKIQANNAILHDIQIDRAIDLASIKVSKDIISLFFENKSVAQPILKVTEFSFYYSLDCTIKFALINYDKTAYISSFICSGISGSAGLPLLLAFCLWLQENHPDITKAIWLAQPWLSKDDPSYEKQQQAQEELLIYYLCAGAELNVPNERLDTYTNEFTGDLKNMIRTICKSLLATILKSKNSDEKIYIKAEIETFIAEAEAEAEEARLRVTGSEGNSKKIKKGGSKRKTKKRIRRKSIKKNNFFEKKRRKSKKQTKK